MPVNQTYTIGGSTVYPAYFQLASYNEDNFVGGELILQWPTVYADNTNAVGGITTLSTTAVDDRVVRLPPVDQTGVGTAFTLQNIGAKPILIQDENKGIIFTLNAGKAQLFYTTNDEDDPWGMWTQGAGSSSADAQALAGYGLRPYGGPPEKLNTVIVPEARDGEPYDVVAADASQLLFFKTSVANVNLPESTDVPSQGFYVYLLNLQGTIIKVNTTGTINGVSEPIYLLPQQSGYFTTDRNNNWYSSEATSSVDPLAFRIAEIDITSTTTTNIPLTDEQKHANVLYLTGSYAGNVNIFINPTVMDGEWIVHNAGVPLNTTTAIVNVGFGTSPTFISYEEILNKSNSVATVKQSVVLYGNTEANQIFVANNFQLIGQGGTSATTVNGAFYNLSPITTEGDMIVGGPASGDGFMSSVADRLAIGPQNSVLVSEGSTPNWVSTGLPFLGGLPYFLSGNATSGVGWGVLPVSDCEIWSPAVVRKTVASGDEDILMKSTYTKLYSNTRILIVVTGSYGSFRTGASTDTSYMLMYMDREGIAPTALRFTTLPSLPSLSSANQDSAFAPFTYSFFDTTTFGMTGSLTYGLVVRVQNSSNYTFYFNQTSNSAITFGTTPMNQYICPITITFYELNV